MIWKNFWGMERGTSLRATNKYPEKGRQGSHQMDPVWAYIVLRYKWLNFFVKLIESWGHCEALFSNCVFGYFHELRNIYDCLCGYNATCVNMHFGLAINDFNSNDSCRQRLWWISLYLVIYIKVVVCVPS
jgi:hypothetical protein